MANQKNMKIVSLLKVEGRDSLRNDVFFFSNGDRPDVNIILFCGDLQVSESSFIIISKNSCYNLQLVIVFAFNKLHTSATFFLRNNISAPTMTFTIRWLIFKIFLLLSLE